MTDLMWVMLGIASVCMITAIIFDLKSGKIPQLITLPAVGVGLIMTPFVYSFEELAFRVALVVVLFVVGMTNVIGLGDIKLLMAVTALQGVMTALFTLGIGSMLVLAWWLIKAPKETGAGVRIGLMSLRLCDLSYIDRNSRKVIFAPHLAVGFALTVIGGFLV